MTPSAQQKMLEQTTIGVRVLLKDTCSPTKNVGADNNWSEVLLNDTCSPTKNVGADNNWSESTTE